MKPRSYEIVALPFRFCIRCGIPACCYSPRMIFFAKALLFDMDGVLIDSAPAVERVWRRWALAHNLNPDHVVAQAHGRRSIETIRAVAPHMDAGRENVHVEQMEIDDKEGVTALPGSVRLLQGMPQSRFAVVTSATRPLAVARLGYAGLSVPSHMVTADDVVQGKPSPEPYLKGAALLGVAAGDCLVFEDTPAGVAAARSAGMRVIALHTTYPAPALAAADAIVAYLADVEVEARGETIAVEVTSLDKVDMRL
jgi:mannitol-1-/sugar-/sorbitol-6-phosphatase